MRLDISVVDSISPMILDILKSHANWLRGTSKSVGWWIQKNTKEEVKAGAPGGFPFKKRTPYMKVRKALEPDAPLAWYGKMRRAIGYEYQDGAVDIGWTSPTAAMIGKWQEEGDVRPVTQQMRNKYSKAKIPLKASKKNIKVPERNIFDPMADEMFPQIPSYVENKAKEYMENRVERGIKKRRVYKVYRA